MKLCTESDRTGCLMLLSDDAPNKCQFCDPNHAPNPAPGTIIDRDGIQVKRGMYGHRYPITARCVTCYAEIGCASGDAGWGHMEGSYARYFATIPETSAVR